MAPGLIARSTTSPWHSAAAVSVAGPLEVVAMNGEAKWERLGAATGILFVALLIVSVFMVPTPPDINSSPATISGFYSDHRTGILVSMYIGGLAVVPFLWFLGSL